MIDESIARELRAHAAREAPRECCGVVSAGRYVPCRNVATDNEHFVIDSADYAAAEDSGEIVAICHSHVNAHPTPSMADRVGCAKGGLPWLIVSHPSGAILEVPSEAYEAPLVGREFCHGVLDCYTLIQDYFRRTLGIVLPDFDREDEWWNKGGDMYREHFAEAGFAPVEQIQTHDVILMQIRSPVPNHAAVYLGNGVILQHVMNRLSTRDIYGGYWQKCTRLVLRHMWA